MNKANVQALVDALLGAYRIASYVNEHTDDQFLLNDVNDLCVNLRDYVINVVVANAPTTYNQVTLPFTYTKSGTNPPWEVTCTGIDPLSKEMR